MFQRVAALPDVAAALIDAGFEAFVAGLPQDAPANPGRRYSNHGTPTVSS